MTEPHEDRLARERIANRPKHWVRVVTACNSRCVFCLDSDTPRNLHLPFEEVVAELRRGLEERGADKVILSGGEASLHPRWVEVIAAARDLGYARVQTVTNGWMYAERSFYERCVRAGLGEITFSLHGDTEALHDRLTGHPGSFARIVKAIARAARDRRVIANVDVVINKQNVAVLDRIVELAISLGITEFDLLHVIPQASAFENREQLFYDPTPHLPVLRKVFRLNRHPGFVVWTNRFPVPFLEGLEDLVQDPHKMLDEVNGRRFMVRRYLDEGRPLDCRDPARCVHCFIEPFCTATDRVLARTRAAGWDAWWIGAEPASPATQVPDAGPLPFGARLLGLRRPTLADALRDASGRPLYAELDQAEPFSPGTNGSLSPTEPFSPGTNGSLSPAEPFSPGTDGSLSPTEPFSPGTDGSLPAPGSVLVADTPGHLAAWLGPGLPEGVGLEVRLDRATGAWLLAHRERLVPLLDRVRLHQPERGDLAAASDPETGDLRDPAAFFAALDLPVRVSGLPACAAPGARLAPPLHRLDRALFDPTTGRPAIRALAQRHVESTYRQKSLRCRSCPVDARCEGLPIAMIRDQGLRLCRPLEGAWAEDAAAQLRARFPEPPRRLADGRPPEPPVPSLPGFAAPAAAPEDPLAVLSRDKAEARRRRRLDILA